mgnify:CR=1 FL=1
MKKTITETITKEVEYCDLCEEPFEGGERRNGTSKNNQTYFFHDHCVDFTYGDAAAIKRLETMLVNIKRINND